MGTELIRQGLDLPLPLWSGDMNVTHPETVLEIHENYIHAGADVITTNTFRTTPRAFIAAGNPDYEQRAHRSLIEAVKLARKAAGKDTRVAGSIAPLEDCYSPELFPGKKTALTEFGLLVDWLTGAKVDILLFETMGCLPEIETAFEASENSELPRWLSLTLKDGNSLLDGSDLVQVLNTLKNYEIETVLINCSPVEITKKGVEIILENWEGSWGVYPNLGKEMPSPEGHINQLVGMEEFENTINGFLHLGAAVVGACCGSTPEHIGVLRKCIDSNVSA